MDLDETVPKWLHDCAHDPNSPSGLKPEHLGMLTGQDKRALEAIGACWKMFAACDEDVQPPVLEAITLLLEGLQLKCHLFARELIAYALDWPDRDKLWHLVSATCQRCGELLDETDHHCPRCRQTL